MGHNRLTFRIQLHDEAPKLESFVIDAESGLKTNQIPLIPDFYCLNSEGYATLRRSFQSLPPWRDRLPIAIWRGSTTGSDELTKNNIKALKRYKLCSYTLSNLGRLDARFNAIVQAATREDQEQINKYFRKVDLLRPRMSPTLMALHRLIVDIDGNVNSWGLLWKLLSGSCILHVESKRQQWFYNRLSPWQTHIPIAEDLHDLEEKLEWSLDHPLESAQIAQNGKQVAEKIVQNMGIDQDKAIDIYAQKYL